MTYGQSTKTIGDDYTKVGLAPGVTFKLDENWGLDFEFVAYNNFMNKTGRKGMTSLVVDPGVIYNFGSFTGGLRLAVDVVATQNWGAIPIIVKTIPIGLVNLLLELDLPIFVRSGRNRADHPAPDRRGVLNQFSRPGGNLIRRALICRAGSRSCRRVLPTHLNTDRSPLGPSILILLL